MERLRGVGHCRQQNSVELEPQRGADQNTTTRPAEDPELPAKEGYGLRPEMLDPEVQ